MKVLFISSGNVKSFEIVPFIKEQGESLKREGIEVDYYPVIGKGVAGYITAGFKLRKFLKDKKYDIIHAHFTLSGYSALIGARGTPVVLSLMGSDAYGEYVGENKVQFVSRYMTLMTYLVQPFVKAIISKSQNIHDYVYLKSKAFIVPNGIDTAKFKAVPNGFREELKLDPAKKQILFLGSKTSVRKNISLVQAALKYIKRNDVELVNPYPITHQAIPKYLNSVHVLAVCSYMEGSPNVVKEAMSCNCPIVATDVGDVKWVLNGVEGCFVSSFKPEEFAENLEAALKYAESKGRTRGEAQIKALGLESETVARRIIDIYKKVLAK